MNLLWCDEYASLTGVPSSMPTSAASSAEKMFALVCSMRPAADFLPIDEERAVAAGASPLPS